MKIDLSLQAPLGFTHLALEGVVEVDFSLAPPFFHPLRTSSCLMALRELSMQAIERQQDKISGIILYRGVVSGEFGAELEALTELAELLHSLGSVVPETIPLYVYFTLARPYTLAETAMLFSKERFLHLQVRVEGSPLSFEEREPPAWAVMLPQPEFMDHPLVEEMLQTMLDKREAFRILPELFACELWHGIDNILFINKCLSRHGMRMLQGFAAAGGETVEFEGIRGRGI